MKIALPLLFSLICFTFPLYVPPKFQKTYRYYKSMIDHQLMENFVKIDVDEEGPYLQATRITSQLTPMFCLSKELLLNGCQFYPFKDEIYFVINDIFKTLPEQSFFLKKVYLLAYQILYFRFGNHGKARVYYTKDKNKPISEAFIIKPLPIVKEYIEHLFEYVPDSIYNFSDENIDLVKKFGFKNEAFNILLKVYNKVLSYSLHHIDSEAEVNSS